MIGTCSLLRRKPSLTDDEFYNHWLRVHGPMAIGMHGVLKYVQSHFVNASPLTNELARSLGVNGMAEMWFDTEEDRELCYTSDRAKVADIDSTLFIGATARFVSEALPLVRQGQSLTAPHKAVFVFLDALPSDLPRRLETIGTLAGVCGLTEHRVTKAGNVPSQKRDTVDIAATDLVTLGTIDAEAMTAARALLLADGGERIAVFDCVEHRLQ